MLINFADKVAEIEITGSALTEENVLKAADLICSNLMRQLSERLGLE